MPRHKLGLPQRSKHDIDAGRAARRPQQNEQAREDTRAHTPKEGRPKMEDKRKKAERPVLPLKGGNGDIDYGLAKIVEENLRKMLENHPKHFKALCVRVTGNNDNIDINIIRDLQDWFLIDGNGKPRPFVKKILQAALLEVPDGTMVISPFDIKDDRYTDSINAIDRERENNQGKQIQRIADTINKISNDKPSNGRS